MCNFPISKIYHRVNRPLAACIAEANGKLIMHAPTFLLKRGREGHQEKESDRGVGVGGEGVSDIF